MKIDYQLEYRKQLQKNVSLVRKEIDNPDFVLKITNHAEKFDREYDEVNKNSLSTSSNISLLKLPNPYLFMASFNNLPLP